VLLTSCHNAISSSKPEVTFLWQWRLKNGIIVAFLAVGNKISFSQSGHAEGKAVFFLFLQLDHDKFSCCRPCFTTERLSNRARPKSLSASPPPCLPRCGRNQYYAESPRIPNYRNIRQLDQGTRRLARWKSDVLRERLIEAAKQHPAAGKLESFAREIQLTYRCTYYTGAVSLGALEDSVPCRAIVQFWMRRIEQKLSNKFKTQ